MRCKVLDQYVVSVLLGLLVLFNTILMQDLAFSYLVALFSAVLFYVYFSLSCACKDIEKNLKEIKEMIK